VICFQAKHREAFCSKADYEGGFDPHGSPVARKTLLTFSSRNLFMNTKSILIATLFAATSSFAFAADVVTAPGADADASVQIAQATPSQMPARTMSARVAKSAAGKDCFVGYSEASSSTVCPTADSRTRAEVRAETLKWVSERRNQASDSIYFGSAQ
jgi:hypothetical protein